MRTFVITEDELNAIANLLNVCKDKHGALLRPSEDVFNRAWDATTAIVSREKK